MTTGSASQRFVTQANSHAKVWHLMLSIVLATLTIIGTLSLMVNAQIDAAIEVHDQSARAHPDVRRIAASNQEIVNAVAAQQQVQTEILRRVEEDVRDIKDHVSP